MRGTMEFLNVYSRNMDGNKAVAEIIEKIGKKGKQPKFILFFSTIHYKDGFKNILNTFKEEFPNILLAGGTVAGFMNQDGCFTMGMTALSFYGDVSAVCATGKDVKRDPEKAADECTVQIKEKMKKMKLYKNKFIFLFTSGPTMPTIPGIGEKFIFRGMLGNVADSMIEVSTKKFQKGFGREEELLQYISNEFHDIYIISVSSSDDNRVKENYQYVIENNNIQILTNSTILTLLSFEDRYEIKLSHGYVPLDKKTMKITDASFGNKIINTIDNKPAFEVFKEKLNIDVNIPDNQLHRKTWFFPFGFIMKDGNITPAAVGGIVKNSFWFSYGAKSDRLCILTASGATIINNFLNIFDKKASFTFGTTCCGNIETLGRKIYLLQEKLKMTRKPFFVIFSLGEGLNIPKKEPLFYNESNILVSFE